MIKLTFQSDLVTFYTHLQSILHYMLLLCVAFFGVFLFVVVVCLLMQSSLADYSAYLHELRVSCIF